MFADEKDTSPNFSILTRSTANSLDAYLDSICEPQDLDGLNATVRCHFILNDGNERPRVDDLAHRVAEEVIDYAIPRSEIERARKEDSASSTSRNMVRLHNKALSLFTDLANTGEGGEMLLYILTESQLGIPQLLCKMPLKTNSRMHYHGADGIHGKVDPATARLTLYWGESKLYKSVKSAVDACFTSLAPFLRDGGGGDATQERDLQLISGNADLNDPSLEAALLRYLDKDDALYRKLEFRGVALVGFDVDHYPAVPNETSSEEVKTLLEADVQSWLDEVTQHIINTELDSFRVEVFCLPFPSVQEFRNAFLSALGCGT